MWLSKSIQFLSKVVHPASRAINAVGVCVIALMMLLTTADVCLRYFAHSPIPGSFETTTLMMVVAVSLCLAYAAVNKSHVNVDVLTSRLSRRGQGIIYSITTLFSLVVCFLASWQCFLQALVLQKAGSATDVLRIPTYPFLFVAFFGFLILGFAFLVEFLKSLSQGVEG